MYIRSDCKDITLLDAKTTTGVGEQYKVGSEKIITFEIYGTSTSRTVQFEGISKSGTARIISCVNLNTLSPATSTTGTGEIWQADVTGLDTFQLNLTAVSGGNVSAKGKAVW